MGKKFWYFTYVDHCVLCGNEWHYKERRFTPKPQRYSDRFEHAQIGCTNCQLSMFL